MVANWIRLCRRVLAALANLSAAVIAHSIDYTFGAEPPAIACSVFGFIAI